MGEAIFNQLFGKEGVARALEEAIEAGKKGHSLFGFGTDIDDYVTHCPEELQEHFEQQLKHKIKWKMLFSEEFKSPNPSADVRLLPKGFTQPVRTMVLGNKVAIVDFTKPITTIIIDKKEVANAYAQHFNFLWRMGKPSNRN
jgi:hypothetical protein